jgi:8-oxo-dGTP pyrophosphatase MutT (NUDIX family)
MTFDEHPFIGTPQAIRERLARNWAREDLLWGDDLLRQERAARMQDLKEAAVLIPLIARATGPTVLLTQRTAHLHDHAGQISFPGGRCEPTDRDAIATALRETEEEIGVPTHAVEILGQLPAYHTASGFRVTPVVGWAAQLPEALRLDTFEVAETFEMPLAHALSARARREERAWVAGRERRYWAIRYRCADQRRRFVWGVTAGILVMLSRALRA